MSMRSTLMSRRKTPFYVCSILSLLTACQREQLSPSKTATTQRALVANTALANPLIGQPTMFPVQMVSVSLVIGAPPDVASSPFMEPTAVAPDALGNFYVADRDHNQIRKVSPGGTVIATYGSGSLSFQDGPSATAAFRAPSGVAVGPDGTIYVADMLNNRIRSITPAGDSVHTLAGSDSAGFADGAGSTAKFNHPTGVAVDAAGTIYVADYGNNMIRKVTKAGVVNIWCGQKTPGTNDGAGARASFNGPAAVTVSPAGIAYVADKNNHNIRKIVSGVVTTLAGGATVGLFDGTGPGAAFHSPNGIATDNAGNIYVADWANDAIRFITPAGVVTTLAGSLPGGFRQDFGARAKFNLPAGIAVGPTGIIYVADQLNDAIRRIDFIPAVRTFAGNGQSGYVSGKDTTAQIFAPYSTTFDRAGNLYIMDGNLRIRKITPDATVSLLAGSGVDGFYDGPPDSAQFNSYTCLTTDPAGNVYVADGDNRRIRKITPDGFTSTFAGNGFYGLDTGAITGAVCQLPSAMQFDAAGNMFITEFGSGLIRKITPDKRIHNFVTLDSVVHKVTHPYMMAMDAVGNIYVSCPYDHTVFKVTSSGRVSIFAGGGAAISGTYVNENFIPFGIAIDAATGNIYIADAGVTTNVIDVYSPAGQIVNVIGMATSYGGFLDGPEAQAQFNWVSGIAISPLNGALYLADRLNNRIRVMSK